MVWLMKTSQRHCKAYVFNFILPTIITVVNKSKNVSFYLMTRVDFKSDSWSILTGVLGKKLLAQFCESYQILHLNRLQCGKRSCSQSDTMILNSSSEWSSLLQIISVRGHFFLFTSAEYLFGSSRLPSWFPWAKVR